MPSDAEPLAAIRQDPDNLELRLIYADWLEEQGQAAHAEWMRGELAHDTTKCLRSRCRTCSKLRKQGEPFQAQVKQLIGGGNKVEFRYGLVTILDYNHGSFRKILQRLFQSGWFACLEYLDLGGQSTNETLIEACQWPEFQWIDGLVVSYDGLNATAIETLDHSPFSVNLQSLTLAAEAIELPAQRALHQVQHLTNVRHLSLWNCADFGELLMHLAADRNLPQLQGLVLVGRNPLISAEGIAALLASPRLPRLRELDVAEPEDPDACLEQLARSLNCALERLFISAGTMSANSLAQFVASPAAACVRDLHLRAMTCTPEICRTLANASRLTQLQTLTLTELDFERQAECLQILLTGSGLPELACLTLYNYHGDVRIIEQHCTLPKLERIDSPLFSAKCRRQLATFFAKRAAR